jgi:hypothetical protein
MRLRLILIAVSCHASLAFAYDVPIHKSLTKKAFAQAIDQNDFLVRLGLKDDKTAIAGMTPSDHAGKGAVDEDNGVRPLNHFFDPVPADGLTGLTDPNGLCFAIGAPAYSWGLEAQLQNSYTLTDANKYQYNFLTGPNPSVRDSNARFLFETVGHLVHLVQDMAQPEHTRTISTFPICRAPSADTHTIYWRTPHPGFTKTGRWKISISTIDPIRYRTPPPSTVDMPS